MPKRRQNSTKTSVSSADKRDVSPYKLRKISESGSGAYARAGTSENSSDNFHTGYDIDGNKPDNPNADEFKSTDESLKIEKISPNKVLFSQDTINSKFSDGRKIDDTLEDLKTGKVTVEMIPKITLIYLEEEHVYFSRDNRRLYVFQKYEDYCDEEIFIPVVVRKPLKDEERSPFKTKGLGKYIEVQQYRNKQGKRVAKRVAQWTPVKISKSSKK